MRRGFSISGLSIILALALAAWEYYFFWHGGQQLFGSLHGSLGWFTPDRLGFNMAWLITLYLTFQLISIPFALPASKDRFVGVLDGMASTASPCLSAPDACLWAQLQYERWQQSRPAVGGDGRGDDA